METEQKFFVYVDYREDNGKPFYVGKGVEKRVKDLQRNFLHTRIKNKHGMVRKIVLETQSEQESFEKEIQLIQELKTHVDFDEGGANLTLGGEGISGYKYTDDQKEERSKLSKKMWEDPEFKEKFKQICNSLEHREKMSESKKKMWEDPEFKEKFKQICNSPEHREKMSESLKKLWEDPEYRKNHFEKMKKKWEDPEYRENHSEKMKKIWEDPEHKKIIGDSMRKLWEDPEHKEKVSDAIKQHHSDPEFRKKHGEKMREVLSDPEIREKISKITKEKLSDPEIRKKMSIEAKERNAKLTPEQRSERIRKGWETRKLRKLQQES